MSSERQARSRATQVTILGQEYVISGDIDPEYVQKIAKYVSDHMKALHEKTVGMSTTRLAVLTAMNIADELLTLRSEIDQAERLGDERADEIESRIDAWLHDIDRQRAQHSPAITSS